MPNGKANAPWKPSAAVPFRLPSFRTLTDSIGRGLIACKEREENLKGPVAGRQLAHPVLDRL
jgi:hypothetical protein